MTEASSLGSMDSAPVLRQVGWRCLDSLGKIAAGQPHSAIPLIHSHIEESKWLSFTTISTTPPFSGHRGSHRQRSGRSGLITFPESNWLASIVLPHQPHFIGQPADVQVFWGYGLFVDAWVTS